jgi:hypothetical protein
MKQEQHGKKIDVAGTAGEVCQLAVRLYLLLLFLMFPLYVENHYETMALCKWRFYLFTTVPFLGITILCLLPRLAELRPKAHSSRHCVCDWLVGIYGGCVLLTFLFCADRQAAWMGAEGWYMGAAAQMLFVLSYFVISRSEIPVSWLLGCNGAGSGLCFLIGILQRLGMDVWGLYQGMLKVELSDYLSTIGNRTWMSGYACAVFPIGVYLFWNAGNEAADDRSKGNAGRRLLWGFYTLLAFAGLAATYSDSAYVGLAVVLFALGVLSIGDNRKILSFLEVLCLWFASHLLMCGLRRLCGAGVRDERGMTTLIYRPVPMLAGLAICAVAAVWVWSCGSCKPKGQKMRLPIQESDTKRRWRRICLAAAGVAVVLNILFVVLNTTGVLQRLFHVTIHNTYLYFDENWGDMRGWTWRMTCKMFGELPLWQKLFGVGADCFASYSYSSVEYAAEFGRIWGDVVLTNAHNEWLNMIFCQGIVGGLAYLGIFVNAASFCLRKASQKVHPIVPGIGLCVLAYMAHNFFCYQQICATGPIFVLMGVAAAVYFKAQKKQPYDV